MKLSKLFGICCSQGVVVKTTDNKRLADIPSPGAKHPQEVLLLGPVQGHR